MPRMVFDAEADQLLRDIWSIAVRAKTGAEKNDGETTCRAELERALLKAYELGKRHGVDR